MIIIIITIIITIIVNVKFYVPFDTKTCHLGNVLPSQSPCVIMMKLNLT